MKLFNVKRNLLVAAFALIGISGFAQLRDIEGRVTNPDGDGIENVKVTPKGVERSVYTDVSGNYTINEVPDSILTLLFFHPEMEDASASIGLYDRVDVRMVTKGSADLMEMSLEDLLNMEVITVSKSAEKQSDAPGIISVLTQDELQRFGGTTLKDVLERVPGLTSATTSYTNRTTMVIRGDFVKQNSSHILVLINGRPVREVQEGGVSSEIFNTFPVNVIDKIEVIKGPGSVLYGSDAFSGVINIITKKKEINSVSVSALAQDGGGFKTTAEAYVSEGDFSATVGGQYYERSEWIAPYESYMFTPIAEPPYYTLTDTLYNVPVPDNGPGAFINMNYKNLRVSAAYNEWNTTSFMLFNDVKNTKFFGNLGYTQEVNDDWSMDLNVTYTQSELLGSQLSQRNSFNFVGEWTNFIKLSERSNLAIGGLYNHIQGEEESLQNADSSFIISEGSRGGFALYAQLDYHVLESLKLIAGVQANKDGDLAMNAVPRAGVIWAPAERWSVKALYSQAYRAPSINELYMNFPGGLYGNENLKPEKVSTIDLGIGYQGEQAQVQLSGFYSKQKDIIQAVYRPMSYEREYVNLTEVTFMGTELEGKYYINKHFYVNASMLYQINEDDTTTNVAPVANFGAKAGASYRSDNGITVSLFNIYQGEPDDKYIGTLNENQGAYNLLHFHSEFKLNEIFTMFRLPEITVLFNIDNVLDKTVYMHDWGGSSYDAIPVIPGRAFYIGARLTLE